MAIKGLIVKVVTNKGVLFGATAIVSGGLGAFGGYSYAKSKLSKEYDERANEEIAAAREHYRVLEDISKFDTKSPEELVAEIYGAAVPTPAMDDVEPEPKTGSGADTVLRVIPATKMINYAAMYDTDGPEKEEPPNQPVVTIKETSRTPELFNVYSQQVRDDMDWDWEEQLAIREARPDKPYIITEEEFLQNDDDWDQISLTYYEGDDILCEEGTDEIVDETDSVVGNHNLISFGVMSNDPNVVYVRNENLEADYEITLAKSKYTETVLNVIEHREKVGIRRFRNRDE